jgi:hypothetical protein
MVSISSAVSTIAFETAHSTKCAASVSPSQHKRKLCQNGAGFMASGDKWKEIGDRVSGGAISRRPLQT